MSLENSREKHATLIWCENKVCFFEILQRQSVLKTHFVPFDNVEF